MRLHRNSRTASPAAITRVFPAPFRAPCAAAAAARRRLVQVGQLTLLGAALALAGCGGGEVDEADDADALVQAAAGTAVDPALLAASLTGQAGGAQKKQGSAPATDNVVYVWNGHALEAVRRLGLNDARAARLYAMVNVAMYDAVNGIQRNRDGRRAEAMVAPGRGLGGASRIAAASAAARAVLTSLNPGAAAQYELQHVAVMANLRHAHAKRQGAAWGEQVAAQVISRRQADVPATLEVQPGSTDIGQFTANWSGSQFRFMTPFAIANAGVYVQSSRPALNSVEYANEFNYVKQMGNAAFVFPFATDTYTFWASGNNTSQPAGEWVKVAMMMLRAKSLNLPDSARLMALLSMSLADVVAPTYSTKYNLHSWRPTTAIRQAALDGNDATEADASWSPRAGTVGSSPEYVSGHSAFAGAGSSVLRGFFCNDAQVFTLQTDGSTTGARTYDSFSVAAEEAGSSRVLGGVHFDFSNRDGLKLGRDVAAEVLANALRRQRGDDRGTDSCPR